jgi:hypothetical protein
MISSILFSPALLVTNGNQPLTTLRYSPVIMWWVASMYVWSHVMSGEYVCVLTCDEWRVCMCDYMWWVTSMYVWLHVMSGKYVCVITCDEWRVCMCDYMWWVASMYVWLYVMSGEYVCVITCDEWRVCMCDHMWITDDPHPALGNL